jgi:hypothetical protein
MEMNCHIQAQAALTQWMGCWLGRSHRRCGRCVVKRNSLTIPGIKPRRRSRSPSQYRLIYPVSHSEITPRHEINKNFDLTVNRRVRPPLLSSGQSSWLQIRWSGFDSRRYLISWQVVSLERGPSSLVSTTEELLGRRSSGSGLENRDYGRRDPPRWRCSTLYPQKLALLSPIAPSV